MNYPPLKRHESLQPFSRDHYVGLVQAQRLMRAAINPDAEERRKVVANFVAAWDREIDAHFVDEERLLSDLALPAERARLLEEHAALRAHAARARVLCEQGHPSPQWMIDLGKLLNDHIRWEERCLFPSIERRADEPRLRELGERTREFEVNHRERFNCRHRPAVGA